MPFIWVSMTHVSPVRISLHEELKPHQQFEGWTKTESAIIKIEILLYQILDPITQFNLTAGFSVGMRPWSPTHFKGLFLASWQKPFHIDWTVVEPSCESHDLFH